MRLHFLFASSLLISALSCASWVLLICGHLTVVQGASSNRRFSPTNGQSLRCMLPPYQDSNVSQVLNQDLASSDSDVSQIPAPVGYCGNGNFTSLSSLSEEELTNLAVAYAPVLFFHPLERHTLSSPLTTTFDNPNNGQIFMENQIYSNTLNLTTLLNTTRNIDDGVNSGSFSLHHNLTDTYLTGDGFYGNLSRASIYFNAFAVGSSAWAFNYHLYYPAQGPANLGVLTSINNKLRNTLLVAPPYGSHEGDWETVQVLVCPQLSAREPIAVGYQQVLWTQVANCTLGECVFYENTTHPVGFVSLYSHATYPDAAESILLQPLQSDAFLGLQGVMAVDRSVYQNETGGYRMFLPNSTNVVRHKEQNEMTLGVTNESDYWQGFGGLWGSTAQSNETYYCLSLNQTEYADCPTEEEDPVFHTVLELLGLKPPSNVVTGAASRLLDSLGNFFGSTTASPRGPATQLSYRNWIPGKNAPIWSTIPSNTTSEQYCNQLQDVPNIDIVAPIVRVVALDQNIQWIITFCVSIMLANILVFTIQECCRRTRPLFDYDEEGKISRPKLRYRIISRRATIVYTIFFVITMVGMGLFFVGYSYIQSVLDKYLGLQTKHMTRVIRVFGTILIIIDTAFLFVVWIPTNDLWYKMKAQCSEMKGMRSLARQDEKKVWWDSEWALTLFRIIHGMLLSSLIFAALIVVFGCINIGLAYGFGQMCLKAIGALNNSCMSINILSVKDIPCGPMFNEFCSAFDAKEISVSLWGSFITAAGHFYLISSAGAASMQFRSLLGMLFSLKSLRWRTSATNREIEYGESVNANDPTQSEVFQDAQQEEDINEVDNIRGNALNESKASFHSATDEEEAPDVKQQAALHLT